MKKFVSIILTLALLCSLAISASASYFLPDGTVVPGKPVSPDASIAIDEPPMPDVMVTVGEPQSDVATVDTYFYDTAAIFGNVEYATNPATGERFLSLSLSDASRLCYLFNQHPQAFRLENNLRLLKEANDIARLYESRWEDDTPINQMLSRTTNELIKKDSSLDMSGALDLIKGRPEYASDEQLLRKVDYKEFCIRTYAKDVMAGLKDVMHLDELQALNARDDYSIAETIELAEKYLESYPNLAALDRVYQVAISGKTSKLLATLKALEPEQVSELHAAVRLATGKLWGEHYSLDYYKFLLPFPDAVFLWPETAE